MQETITPQLNTVQKLWREIKRPFTKGIRILPRFSIYRSSIPKEGIKYIGNDEVGLMSVEMRMEKEFFEVPAMVVTNQSIGRYFIRDAKRIINIGSGVGTFEHNNATEHPDALFVASEFDLSCSDWSKRNRPMSNVVFGSDDIETLCKTYGKFDLAVCIDVIEHMKNYGDFLREFVQLADRAVIATPNRDRCGHDDSYNRITDLQVPPYKYHTHEFNAGEFYFLLKAFYKNVELYSSPSLFKQGLIPVGIYSSYANLVAHCHNK